MNNTAMILTYLGQQLDETTKNKIEKAVKVGVEEYGITDFYFMNEDEGDLEDSPSLKDYYVEREKINRFTAESIKDFRNNGKANIRTAIVVARTVDKNYDKSLYDEVIQGYTFYFGATDSAEDCGAFTLRDNFLSQNIEYVLWCSNRLLYKASSLTSQISKEKIIII